MWLRWFHVKWRVCFANRKLNNIFGFLFFGLPVHGISKIQLTTDGPVQFITRSKQETIHLRAHHSGFKYSGMWSYVAYVAFCDVVKVLLSFETSGHISTASQNRCANENSRNNYLLQIFVKFKFFTQRTQPFRNQWPKQISPYYSTYVMSRLQRNFFCMLTRPTCWQCLDHWNSRIYVYILMNYLSD
jgi:hypothetical protein